MLPRAQGDADDAELVVYYFGESGGSVAASIERWLGRMQQPGHRLRAAAVETPNGPYFIELTGPAKTVGAADAAYERFLSSLTYQPRRAGRPSFGRQRV